MIHLGYTKTGVKLSAGAISFEAKPPVGVPPAYLEDSISQVFQKANISHKVRDFATKSYTSPTKLYLEKDRHILALETECGESVDLLASAVLMAKLLTAAGVPYES